LFQEDSCEKPLRHWKLGPASPIGAVSPCQLTTYVTLATGGTAAGAWQSAAQPARDPAARPARFPAGWGPWAAGRPVGRRKESCPGIRLPATRLGWEAGSPSL